jgi:hypothetical protein
MYPDSRALVADDCTRSQNRVIDSLKASNVRNCDFALNFAISPDNASELNVSVRCNGVQFSNYYSHNQDEWDESKFSQARASSEHKL